MPKPKADSSKAGELDAFDRQVEAALECCSDPAKLGSTSPLAAPYFIGRALQPVSGHPPHDADLTQRGETLRALLQTCANQLDDELQHLLHVAFFERQRHQDNIGLAQRMNMSERTFYRAKQRAIKGLAYVLNRTVAPPLRAESPADRAIAGRTAELSAILNPLRERKSVYVVGPSGIGKTALCSVVAGRWRSDAGNPVFWYTLRHHVNDHPDSLVFTLSHFLRTLGPSATWRQLVADHGMVDFERTLSLLRFDLLSPQASALMVCIDDTDILRDNNLRHVQIVNLLEALRSHVPLLLIGQRVILDTDATVVLSGLDANESSGLLESLGLHGLDEAVKATLIAHTRSHPWLFVLYASLVRTGEEPTAALNLLMRAPSTAAIFHRIWRRLDDDERSLLAQLSVFRTPAPLDAWPDSGPTLARLRDRALVAFDGAGAISLPAHLHDLIYEHVPADDRATLHLRAAEIRVERAEVVAAMHHAIQGKVPAYAVWLWFSCRQEEIERGQGPAALALLQSITLAELPEPRDRTSITLALSELYRLAGLADDANRQLDLVPPGQSDVLSAYTHFVSGQVKEMQDQVDLALQHYRQAIDLYVGLPAVQEVLAHIQLSFLRLYRQHDVDRARRDATLANAKIDAFLGDLDVMAGNYQAALEKLRDASKSIEPYGDELATRSRIYSYLGALYGRMGETEQALDFIDRAIACDKQRGDRVGPLYDTLNRSAALYVAGRYEESRRDALSGLAAAEQLHNSYLIAGLSAGAAEACAGLGLWTEAEQYALHSLSQEEEFFRAPALGVFGLVRGIQHRYDDATRLLEEALESAAQIDDRYMEAVIWRYRASVLNANGDTAAATEASQTAATIFSQLGLAFETTRTNPHGFAQF